MYYVQSLCISDVMDIKSKFRIVARFVHCYLAIPPQQISQS